MIDPAATQRSPLDDLLALIDLRCTVYHNQQLCGDWELAEHEVGQTCFHLVSHGTCELSWAGRQWQLSAGDLVLFPAEEPHRLRTLEPAGQPMQSLRMDQSIDAPNTGLMCASVQFAHQASRALLAALPPMTLLRRTEASEPWLTPLLQQILRESRQPAPGQAAVLDHLAELVFMQAIRYHDNQAGPRAVGILNLLRDARLARAIRAFHAAPAHHWTLDALATEAAMSRSRFAVHFRATSGWTPAHYMTWWRMQVAWTCLQRGDSVLSVAQAVGYRSEAAFSRAFQRAFGTTAGAVRRARNA